MDRNNGNLGGGALAGYSGRSEIMMKPVERLRQWPAERETPTIGKNNSNSMNQSLENKNFIGQGASNGLSKQGDFLF